MTQLEKYVKAHLQSALLEVLENPRILQVDNGLSIYEKALIYHYTKVVSVLHQSLL